MPDHHTATPPTIHGVLRLLFGVIAIALATASIIVLCCPPVRVHTDKDANGEVVKQTESPADLTTPFTVVFLSACGLLLYVVNGYRITKFAAAGLEAETTPSAAKQASNYFNTASLDPTVATKEIATDSPEPTEAPSKVLAANGEALSVFELKDIPFTVIADAFSNWPSSTPRPNNLAEFEFATRKQGKGNHPWILKFNGCKPVTVSYGGRAKTGSTVDAG